MSAKAVAFLGAFLAFCLELAGAKLLLPRLGGSAYVWTGALMVYQGLLLAGYAGAGAAARRPWAHRAALLLAAPFLLMRLPPMLEGAPAPAQLLWGLLGTVAAPFLVLSMTVPVLQSLREEEGYHLYAASNLGALAALLGYPLLIEPYLGLGAQSRLWLGLYAVYAALFWRRGAGADAPTAGAGERRPLLWALLAAAPSAAMLASSNLLGFDFAAIPLLWIVPLAIYLSTFVLNFRARPLEQGRMNSALLPLLGAWVLFCLALAGLSVLRADESAPVQTLRRLMDVGKFGYLGAALFVIGMICHRSLYASRPADKAGMRAFYLWIALGGWLGSVCIGVLAPLLGRRLPSLALDWLIAGGLAGAALLARDREAIAARAGRRAPALVMLGLGAAIALAAALPQPGVRRALRNFYGVYAVKDEDGIRRLMHGNTDHGAQALEPGRRGEPLAYYGRRGALGEAFPAAGETAARIAVVGLGAGALAAYARAGQELDFYELDPDVERLARAHFSYLADSPARVRVIVGDARLELEKRADARYDLIVLDAFHSGAAPVHLLTREALELYLSRLEPGGTILLHVSNRYLDLRPMLGALAGQLGLASAGKRVTQKGLLGEGETPSSWAAMSADARRLEALRRAGWEALPTGGRAWTDEHASLLGALAL